MALEKKFIILIFIAKKWMLKGKGGRLLNKKILAIISFLIIFMISCTYAADFKINDGFTAENEYYSVNDENGMYMPVNFWMYAGSRSSLGR